MPGLLQKDEITWYDWSYLVTLSLCTLHIDNGSDLCEQESEWPDLLQRFPCPHYTGQSRAGRLRNGAHAFYGPQLCFTPGQAACSVQRLLVMVVDCG